METLSNMFAALGMGLPTLLLQFMTTLVLLAVGVGLYAKITPFNEHRLIGEGNIAAAVVFVGTIIALAIPLASTLANSGVTLDIVLWGSVGIILQLIVVALAILGFKNLREKIEANNVAAALSLVGVQIAVALLNAGAMAG